MTTRVQGTFEVSDDTDEITGKVIVVLEGRNFNRDLSFFGLSLASTDREIMNKIVPVISEEYGQDISRSYKVRKDLADGNVFVIPNSTAGKVSAV